jgi:hypothetical protein
MAKFKRENRDVDIGLVRSLQQHPSVMEVVDPGLSGGTYVDNLIYATELARNQDRSDPVLKAGYLALKRLCPRSFATPNEGIRSGEPKPSAYKAINGF